MSTSNITNPFQLPWKNTKLYPNEKKKNDSSNSTPLTPIERLTFFLRDRQELALRILEELPSEVYDQIIQTPCTATTSLLHKINQLRHITPEGSHLVIRPNSSIPDSSILKLLITLIAPQSQKIWAIENGLCYGLVSHSYHDRIHLFPTLTMASSKLRDLCSDKLYFKFYSTPPTWEFEEYEPAQHIVFVTEYYFAFILICRSKAHTTGLH